MKHWEVNGSIELPPREGSSYRGRQNITAHVLAASARRAIELVEAKHVGIEVHSVQHRGRIDVIEDTKDQP